MKMLIALQTTLILIFALDSYALVGKLPPELTDTTAWNFTLLENIYNSTQTPAVPSDFDEYNYFDKRRYGDLDYITVIKGNAYAPNANEGSIKTPPLMEWVAASPSSNAFPGSYYSDAQTVCYGKSNQPGTNKEFFSTVNRYASLQTLQNIYNVTMERYPNSVVADGLTQPSRAMLVSTSSALNPIEMIRSSYFVSETQTDLQTTVQETLGRRPRVTLTIKNSFRKYKDVVIQRAEYSTGEIGYYVCSERKRSYCYAHAQRKNDFVNLIAKGDTQNEAREGIYKIITQYWADNCQDGHGVGQYAESVENECQTQFRAVHSITCSDDLNDLKIYGRTQNRKWERL